MSLKQKIKSFIGLKNLGRYDYFSKPEAKKIWGGSFNGQEFRRKMFLDICANNTFSLIVETGSFRGNTTEFMAKRSIPILTVEFDLRLYGYVSTRFFLNHIIKTYQNDSRVFLKQLCDDDSVSKSEVFFYLDAHWNQDLPLSEELSIIFSKWKKSVVMIDDFEVPDTQYAYDDYGAGKSLSLDYLMKVKGSDDYSMFFPMVDETQETGFKRGSIVICNDVQTAEKLRLCRTLNEHYP